MKMIQETFPKAISDFKSFLFQNSVLGDLIWLFQEDVCLENNEVLINLSSVSHNDLFAERVYEFSQKRNLGIELNAFCQTDSKIGCSFVLPDNELDAEYKRLNSAHLKFSFNEKLLQAKLVRFSTIDKLKMKLNFSSSSENKILRTLLPSKNSLKIFLPV